MFEILGFIVCVLFCAGLFLYGFFTLYAGFIFNAKDCIVFGLVVLLLSSYGMYYVCHKSPYTILVKTEQSINDKHIESTKKYE